MNVKPRDIVELRYKVINLHVIESVADILA